MEQTSAGATAPPASPPSKPVSPYVHWLDARRDPPAGVAGLGGKAASLVRLLRAGLPVPPGFVVLPGAFAGPAPDGAPGALLEGAAPDIQAAYATLARRLGEGDPAVAVRSSAGAEDLPQASAAGVYTTSLGVRGAGAVLDHVARCAASHDAPRAVAYRRRLEQAGHHLPASTMSVVVQAMVPADAAGVAFTADPVSGDRGQVVVNGAWGLGQSVVDGEVEGDSWRVDRRSMAILEARIGRKETRTGDEPEAPRVAVAEGARNRACLQPDEVQQVAGLALQAERVLGQPADAEWALAEGWVYLLQARPITALPPQRSGPDPAPDTAPETAPRGPAPGFPFVWPSPELTTLHWRLEGGAGAGPALPWEEDERGAGARAGRYGADLIGGATYRRPLYLNGYRYSTEVAAAGTPDDRERRRAAFRGLVSALLDRDLTYWETVLLPEAAAGNRRLAAVRPDTLTAADLAAHLHESLRWNARLWTLHGPALRTLRGGGDDADTMRRRLDDLLARVPAPEAGDGQSGSAPLLAGVANKLSEAIDGLFDLARIVQRHPDLRNLFETEAVTEATIMARFPDTPGGGEFGERLERLLAEQELRSDAGAFTVGRGGQPGWADQPTLVLALVRRYVAQDLDAIARGQAAALAARDARTAAVRAAIPDVADRERFDALLDGARREARGYEDHNYFLDSAAGALLHRALTAAGRRLAGAGLLPAAEDVRWLRCDEIACALRGLDAPPTPDAPDGPPTPDAPDGPPTPDAPDGPPTPDAPDGPPTPDAPDGPPTPDAPDGPPTPDASPAPGAPVTPRTPRWDLLLQARRALHEWQRSLTPPDWLGAAPAHPAGLPGPSGPGGPGGPPPGPPGVARPAPPADALVAGQPGSPGVATGRVRLVPRDALVPEVAPGDVLVAHNAGALWTPVFPVATAVVLDEGTLLQHAMLTCREYGVPGVFQTKQASTTLREGQRVTVDGTNGWVLPA